MTVTLPESYDYGFITCRIIQAVGDSKSDVDRLPEARASVGVVRFEPLTKLNRVLTSPTAFVGHEVVTASLGPTGEMLDAEGLPGLWLITGHYQVSFNLSSGATIPPFKVEVLTEHTLENPLDLVTAEPVENFQVPLPQTIGEAVAEAEGYADAAGVSAGQAIQAAAQSSGLTLIESPPGSGFLAYHSTLLTESPADSGFLEIGFPA